MPRAKVPSPELTRLEQIAKVTAGFTGFKQARSILTSVKSIPTIFPQFDVATTVKGLPLQRVILIHGPSNHGKTALMLGLLNSFVARDHIAGLVDAEFTTTKDWTRQMMGDLDEHPGLTACRPASYEETKSSVRDMIDKITAAKEAGDLPSDMAALVGIDSIGKLVPQNLSDKVAEGKGGVDGMSGRAGQIMASLNGAWLNELIPLAYHANVSVAIITRESENVDAQAFEQQYKVRGGKALIFDSSLVLRVERDKWITATIGGKKNQTIGERHRITIHKTKVGGKVDRVIVSHFHTSNGVWVPAGFDRARDVFQMAVGCKLVKKRSSVYESTLTGEVWKGENAAVKALTDSPDCLQDMETKARELWHPGEMDPGDVFQVKSAAEVRAE